MTVSLVAWPPTKVIASSVPMNREIREKLKRFDKPFLTVWGGKDMVTPGGDRRFHKGRAQRMRGAQRADMQRAETAAPLPAQRAVFQPAEIGQQIGKAPARVACGRPAIEIGLRHFFTMTAVDEQQLKRCAPATRHNGRLSDHRHNRVIEAGGIQGATERR